MKTIICVLSIILSATFVYAGNGDLTVLGNEYLSNYVFAGSTALQPNLFNTYSRAYNFNPRVQVAGASAGNSSSALLSYQSNGAGPNLLLGHARGDKIGSQSALNNTDELGRINFQGSDGTNFLASAAIMAIVNGTPGTNSMPTDLVFSTRSSTGTDISEAMRITSLGNVGIGMTGLYKLQVNGTIYATGVAGALSDVRDKDNIQDLAVSGLDTVSRLRPVTFTWKEPQDDGMKGEQIGFIAQEVEQVLPQAVLTAPDEDQTKGLKYNELIPILTKAIQEQQAQIQGQQARIEALEQQVAALQAGR